MLGGMQQLGLAGGWCWAAAMWKQSASPTESCRSERSWVKRGWREGCRSGRMEGILLTPRTDNTLLRCTQGQGVPPEGGQVSCTPGGYGVT